MSSIGIYHIDLWHSAGAVPNLELIKVYNYFYRRGDQVIMAKPQDNLERFNQVFFFKDSKKPLGKDASAKINVENRVLMGYGFFGKVDKLEPEIFNQTLNYKCYDEVSYRLSNKTDYSNMAKNSLVRIETQDFTDLKKDKRIIFINDENLAAVPHAADFLQEYKQYILQPLHSIKVDATTIEEFIKYEQVIRGIFVCHDYTPDLFLEYYTIRKLAFNFSQRPGESELHYMKRLLVIGLLYKNKKISPPHFTNLGTKGMVGKISSWILKNDPRSFATFYSDDKEIQKAIINSPSEIRCLYKTNPLSITPSTFDLKEYF